MQTLSVATTENWPTCLGHYRRRGDAPHKERYAYVPNGDQTALLASYQNGSDTAYTYTYDDNGNITRIQQGALSVAYTYDAANQLIREDNGFINKTVTYTYDSWGNILTKSEYPYTTGTLGTPSNSVNYTYTNSAWGDQLTSYDGETISYDAMGNPVSYRGYATSFEGKQLVSAVKTGKNITFAYDENGLRTQKTINGVSTNYYYNGSVLMSMTKGDTSLLFSYDAAGNVVAVEVQSDSWYIDGQTLYYIRNGQGDITGLINSSGRTVIEYRYDTWGKDCSYQPEYQEYLELQELNPFRYRGYVYDTETGWYYLQSRYYDPATCRFISADILLSTGQGVLGHNMFAYCRNNPISRVDVTGHSDEETDEPDEPDGPDEPDIYDLIRGNIILAMIVRGAGLLAIRYPVVLCGSRLGWFYFLVKKDGPMDYKNQDRWKSALPNLEYPGDDGEEKKYWFNGVLISASDLGNINYGAVGAALGIPLGLLLQQAGAAQLRDHEGAGIIESQFDSLGDDYFGDERDDYYNIKLGYKLYMEGYFCDE